MTSDKDVILNALQRERNELHERIMQIDRIIKKVRDVNEGSNDNEILLSKVPLELNLSPTQKTITASGFTKTKDIKLQVLNVFDVIGKAAKFKQLQATYFKISDNAFSIREIIKGLNRQGLLLKMR
jgi:hypothetical protein